MENGAGAATPELAAAVRSVHALLRRSQLGVQTTQRQLDEAQRQVKDLQGHLRESQAIEQFLSKVTTAQSEGQVSEALRVLRSGSKVVAKIAIRENQAGEQVRGLERALTAQVEDNFQELVRSFPQAARDAGLALDASSRHPKYTLNERLVQVDFDKSRLEARVTTPGGRRASLGIDISVVIPYLTAVVARLAERPFDPQAFAARLEVACSIAAKASDSSGTEGSVPLKSVIDVLGDDKSFAIDEFVVDLAKLVRTSGLGSRIRLDHTRDASAGVLLWGLEDRGYYGYIRVE
ncbi:MAG: hypothetical protein KF727_12190 [Microbacteriaceae bacterium]|nr:hypothetical protein [Microbacteriaceae bacterium]